MVSRATRARGVPGFALAAALMLVCVPSGAWAACADLLPDLAASGPARAIAAQDLVMLREIGFTDAFPEGPSPLSVSPDGRQVAFVLNRADPETNGYCRALVVLPIAPSARPRMVDAGGELITVTAFVRGLALDYGMPKVVTPAWSPDGARIAYLRRDKGVTQAWVARADGSGAQAATREKADVETVGWSPDGKLIFATRRRAPAIREAIEREGRSGWLYDDRVATNSGPTPRLRESDAPLESFLLDLRNGALRPAGGAGASGRAGEGSARLSAVSASGRRAWVAPEDSSLLSAQRLWAADATGAPAACQAAECRNVSGMWWDRSGTELRFLRREGWNRETYAFYRWKPGGSAPRRAFATRKVIQNCVPASGRLLCTMENATTPRRVILLDPETGTTTLVFDPNPEFARIRLGSVQRLRFANDRGLEAWGDLVLPPGHRRGRKLPMVVVQYHSRGFLRGGTGDEYPIFLLAARGYAVLSFERPSAVASAVPGLMSVEAVNAANQKGWADRWSLLSSLSEGVKAAIATGNVDPRRLGITGLSDGATTARFAVINTNLFAAAAIRSCCLEPKTVMTYGGIRFAEFNRAVGFPPATVDDPGFWRPMSMALNAARMDTPLLMQLADEEYLVALEAFQALREKGKPVELYVYPDEHHGKSQPVHRLAVYDRNLDWFDFWLQCREDPDPAKRAQYERWRAMRTRSSGSSAACPGLRKQASSNGPTPRRRPAA